VIGRLAWTDTIALGQQHGLSAYDAAYLEFALREGAPLATLDAKLEVAATAVGVTHYQP
jgi:predicted nucleic acid-binding protein